jgi:hypothetical protein
VVVFVCYLLRSLDVVRCPPTDLAFLFARIAQPGLEDDSWWGGHNQKLLLTSIVGRPLLRLLSSAHLHAVITRRNLPPIVKDGMLSILCRSPSVAALHRGTTMGRETYPPIVNFLSPSVARRLTSNARMIWQTVLDRHRLLLSIISADVLWSIKGVGVER